MAKGAKGPHLLSTWAELARMDVANKARPMDSEQIANGGSGNEQNEATSTAAQWGRATAVARRESVNDEPSQTLKQSSGEFQGDAVRAAQIMKLNRTLNVDLTESAPRSSADIVVGV
jgi:hypothetical protein